MGLAPEARGGGPLARSTLPEPRSFAVRVGLTGLNPGMGLETAVTGTLLTIAVFVAYDPSGVVNRVSASEV
jgi:hypothetical protein